LGVVVIKGIVEGLTEVCALLSVPLFLLLYRNEKEPGLHVLSLVSSVVGASVTAGVVVAAIAWVAVPQQNTTVYNNTLRKPIYLTSKQLSTRPALFGHFRRLSACAPALTMRPYRILPHLLGKAFYRPGPRPPVGSLRISELTLELLKPLGGLKNKLQERVISGRNDHKNSKSWLEAKDRTRRRLHTWLRQTTKECRLQPSEQWKLRIAAEYRSGLVESY